MVIPLLHILILPKNFLDYQDARRLTDALKILSIKAMTNDISCFDENVYLVCFDNKNYYLICNYIVILLLWKHA